MATPMPTSSPLGGSMPANSRTWPWAPTARSAVLSALTPSRMTLASLADTSRLPLASVRNVIVEYATWPSGLTDAKDFASVACSAGVRAFIAAGLTAAPVLQPVPSGLPCASRGLVTQVTESRAATLARRGAICAAVAASTAVPVAGDQTMDAPPSSLLVSVPLVARRSVATFDSVLGRSNLSFSVPPNAWPRPTTAISATNHAMRAMTGRRTAHVDRPGMDPLPDGGATAGRASI